MSAQPEPRTADNRMLVQLFPGFCLANSHLIPTSFEKVILFFKRQL